MKAGADRGAHKAIKIQDIKSIAQIRSRTEILSSYSHRRAIPGKECSCNEKNSAVSFSGNNWKQ
jgi:hypothetical protein